MVRVDNYEVREGLYYSKEHFWVRVEGSAARVGATDYGQKALKDLVFIELPTEGVAVTRNEPCGTIESVKAVVDIVAPLSGVVKETNKALKDAVNLVNQDPYGKGWLFTITPSKLNEELKNLLSFNDAVGWYKELVKEG